jgi:hypothetical protein
LVPMRYPTKVITLIFWIFALYSTISLLPLCCPYHWRSI